MRLNASHTIKSAALTATAAAAVLAIPAAGSATAATGTGTAQATTATSISSTCKHHGRNYVVRTYPRGHTKYTLRCGTSKWGWKHIKAGHGWNARMDQTIKSVIAHGTSNGRGGFSSYIKQCPPTEKFRTIMGTPAGKKDLLTAYKVDAKAAGKC